MDVEAIAQLEAITQLGLIVDPSPKSHMVLAKHFAARPFQSIGD
jgi:3-deoxy-D-arabino-heptulosonate 7-phosphate (DAHP) synthase